VDIGADNDPDFTDSFCGFLQRCVANVDGAELLLVLKNNPEQSFALTDLAARLVPTRLPESEVARHVATFEQCGVVAREGERVRFQSSEAADPHVSLLARLYIERPVTLFRVIYALRDTKIKTFADAFKLR
jgi:hypothetical protein